MRCGPPRTSRTLLASENLTWNLLCQGCPHVNLKGGNIIVIILSGTDQIPNHIVIMLLSADIMLAINMHLIRSYIPLVIG